MHRNDDCEACVGTPKGRATRIAKCPNCEAKKRLCVGCWSTWIACNRECQEKWRATAARGLPPEPLLSPMGAKKKKPKGYGVYQKEF